MTYPQFKAEWLGRRIDYDHVYDYQCVDLVLEYIKECYGLASGVTGNAIDYWNKPSLPLLSKFTPVKTTVCSPGDVVVLNGHTGNPDGHIGICDSQTTDSVTILEQNGADGNGSGVGGDVIRLRAIPKTRIAGVLKPKATNPVPTTQGGTATVLGEAYVRVAPNVSAALGGSRVLEPGDTFLYSGKVVGQDVAGNHVWYKSKLGHYVWSGNCKG